MTVIERIERTRERRGLKQYELEAAAGLPKGRVSKWVNGTGEPHASEALRIARVLDVPLEWLADADAPDDPPRELEVVRETELHLLAAIRRLGVRESLLRLVGTAPGQEVAAPPGNHVVEGRASAPIDFTPPAAGGGADPAPRGRSRRSQG